MSASVEKKIFALLKQHRFTLVRQTKHKVYQEPGGRVFVTSATPSDWRAAENALSMLKRVIQNPPQPMVLAISEYERKEAAEIIRGLNKQHKAAPGMGSGKQRRSRGTGFIYEDQKVLTDEQIQHNEMLRQQAIANVQRREEKKQERRADKLARREKAETLRQQEAAQFEEKFRPFLNHTQSRLDDFKVDFDRLCESMVAQRAWQSDSNYYEFPVPGSDDEAAENWAHVLFDNEDGCDTLELDEYMSGEKKYFQKYLARSAQTQNRVLKFVERQVRDSDSVMDLVVAVNEATERMLTQEWETWDIRQFYNHLSNALVVWFNTVTQERALVGAVDAYIEDTGAIFVNEAGEVIEEDSVAPEAVPEAVEAEVEAVPEDLVAA